MIIFNTRVVHIGLDILSYLDLYLFHFHFLSIFIFHQLFHFHFFLFLFFINHFIFITNTRHNPWYVSRTKQSQTLCKVRDKVIQNLLSSEIRILKININSWFKLFKYSFSSLALVVSGFWVLGKNVFTRGWSIPLINHS